MNNKILVEPYSIVPLCQVAKTGTRHLHWFMTLVLTTSTGEVVNAVQNPAIMEAVT